MAATTGPILAAGALNVANRVIVHQQGVDWRVPIATALLAGVMTVVEKGFPQAATLFAWGILLTVIVTRTDPKVPSPAESFIEWWK